MGHNVRAICWIVPKKYLLLLDQTILLHFRSSIDRPLNGYLRIPVVITISVSRKKIYNQSLGAYEKNYFGWSGIYFWTNSSFLHIGHSIRILFLQHIKVVFFYFFIGSSNEEKLAFFNLGNFFGFTSFSILPADNRKERCFCPTAFWVITC